jgi:pyruvate kinase
MKTHHAPLRRTKIVCTIGPATSSPAAIRRLAVAGMDVARLNFSYGTHESHAAAIVAIRSIAADLGRPIAILQDLCGPKLRVGELLGGQMPLRAGDEVTIRLSGRVTPGDIPLPLPELAGVAESGQRLMFADGRIELRVVDPAKSTITCRVIAGGLLESHQGINVPDVALPIRTVTPKDIVDFRFGIDHEVDWVAMSFVRGAHDLAPLRRLAKQAGADVPIISKIEKHEAITGIDSIIAASDGIMVARGDLGVELPLAEVPVLQKDIIGRCNAAGKPVITATQMLESMIASPRPTRAEVSDVANAVFDGTDAVMLSGETAAGHYPAAAVRVMAEVIDRAEAAYDFDARWAECSAWPCHTIADGISEAACGLARDVEAAAIISATSSGQTALAVARQRPKTRLIAVTPNVATLRRMSLVWGVHALLATRGRNTDELIVSAIDRAKQAGFVRAGDRVVVTAGVPRGAGNTNLIKVEVVGQHERL